MNEAFAFTWGVKTLQQVFSHHATNVTLTLIKTINSSRIFCTRQSSKLMLKDVETSNLICLDETPNTSHAHNSIEFTFCMVMMNKTWTPKVTIYRCWLHSLSLCKSIYQHPLSQFSFIYNDDEKKVRKKEKKEKDVAIILHKNINVHIFLVSTKHTPRKISGEIIKLCNMLLVVVSGDDVCWCWGASKVSIVELENI